MPRRQLLWAAGLGLLSLLALWLSIELGSRVEGPFAVRLGQAEYRLTDPRPLLLVALLPLLSLGAMFSLTAFAKACRKEWSVLGAW